ncbi:MAG TPA: hypothetical protein VI542_13560 [Candidatus Tectomicrobia bacterium]
MPTNVPLAAHAFPFTRSADVGSVSPALRHPVLADVGTKALLRG